MNYCSKCGKSFGEMSLWHYGERYCSYSCLNESHSERLVFADWD